MVAKKVLAYAPGVAVSTVLTMTISTLLPEPVGWLVFVGGLSTVTALLTGVGERAAVRCLYRARPLTAAEADALAPTFVLLCQHGLGPPVVDLWVKVKVRLITAEGLGRRSVVLSGGLVASIRDGQLPADQAAAVIGHAAGIVRAGATRSDFALLFWTIPWQILSGLAQGVAQSLSWLPLVGSVWRLRFVVGLIALIQGWNEGTTEARVGGGLSAGVILLSYLVPRWESAWAGAVRDIGDEQLRQAELAEPLARFLRRCSSSPATFERIHRLRVSVGPARPSLAVVTLPRTGP